MRHTHHIPSPIPMQNDPSAQRARSSLEPPVRLLPCPAAGRIARCCTLHAQRPSSDRRDVPVLAYLAALRSLKVALRTWRDEH